MKNGGKPPSRREVWILLRLNPSLLKKVNKTLDLCFAERFEKGGAKQIRGSLREGASLRDPWRAKSTFRKVDFVPFSKRDLYK